MMEPDFDFQAMMAEHARMRDRYLDAVRDWVANGPASRWALSPDALRARLAAPNPDHARATAWFRLGTLLHLADDTAGAQRAFAEAKRLRPESWNFKRQAWHLEEAGKSGGPEFWAEVKALGTGRTIRGTSCRRRSPGAGGWVLGSDAAPAGTARTRSDRRVPAPRVAADPPSGPGLGPADGSRTRRVPGGCLAGWV
jgi:hypothetical protein